MSESLTSGSVGGRVGEPSALPRSRRPPASARASLPLSGAAHRGRSASNGRLSWGEQAYKILSQYPAILDITTYLSLNKLFGYVRPSPSPWSGRGSWGKTAWPWFCLVQYWLMLHSVVSAYSVSYSIGPCCLFPVRRQAYDTMGLCL